MPVFFFIHPMPFITVRINSTENKTFVAFFIPFRRERLEWEWNAEETFVQLNLARFSFVA